MHWSEISQEKRQRKIAWAVATSTANRTKEDPLDVYQRIMKDFETLNKTNESQNSGNT
jgi:hypothetical protein